MVRPRRFAGRWLAPLLAVLCTSCAAGRTLVGRQSIVRPDSSGALQVPYVSQSELLCGGAAIAMIERWWGRRGVYAEDFSYLVHRDSGGIFTADMAPVLRSRGWNAEVRSATSALVSQSLVAGVPVVALIRVGPQRYHYVVIVAWNDTDVTYHDPAVRPFAVTTVRNFEQQWESTNRWAMFVRPTPVATPPPNATHALPSLPVLHDSLPCRPFLDQAADAAAADHLADADRILAVALAECPSEPLVLRELAGVRFRQGKQSDAIRLASAYTQRAPLDSLGWQLLASSRYLAGDARGALVAWNVIGRPTIDLLRIDGTKRVRFGVLARAIGVTPGRVLTPSRIELAARRIADVPALTSADVRYRAGAGGVVEVRAAVVEHPVVAPWPQLLLINAARTMVRDDVELAVSTPFGVGEVWTAHYRWESADPRVALLLDIPTQIGLPGIVSLERSWETYRFSGGVPDGHRGASSVTLRTWLRPGLEQMLGARFERWSADGEFVTLSLGGALHTAQDRVTLLTEGERGIAIGGGKSYHRVKTRGEWKLPADRWRNVWSLRLGGDWTGASAPRGLWTVAGGNLSRDVPLRAHPLIVDRVFPLERTGRLIFSGGAAGDRAVARRGPIAIGFGVFVDAAHVMSSGAALGAGRLYVDAGAGVQFALMGAQWSAFRVDVARGVGADRKWGLSAGLVRRGVMRLGWRR